MCVLARVRVRVVCGLVGRARVRIRIRVRVRVRARVRFRVTARLRVFYVGWCTAEGRS